MLEKHGNNIYLVEISHIHINNVYTRSRIGYWQIKRT